MVPTGISFNVMKDVFGSDPVIFSNVTRDTVTSLVRERSLYIANPQGASASFDVQVLNTP